MRKACPLSELAPGEALRLDTAPPAAKLPVRTHEVQIVDGNTMIIESDEAPNLPPGLTTRAMFNRGPCLAEQRTRSWLLTVT